MPNTTDHTVPCPVCSTKIPIDVKLLIQGTKFTCPNCHAAIAIEHTSKPLLQDAIDKMEQLKNKIGDKK
jgi:predicted RNA-binding Zn-ribbon protein involved in translation (DUF1610 family)